MDVRRKLVAKAKRKLAKTGKVEERFRVSLSKGNYYEAHQTLRVLYERYVSLGRNDEAWILLQKGTVQLLTHDQWESGTELALLLVEHLKEKETKVNTEIIDKLEELFCSYKYFKEEDYSPHPWIAGMRICPVGTLNKEEQTKLHVLQTNRDMFTRAALKWTSLVDKNMRHGYTRFHKLLAFAYFEEGDLEKSRKHFIYANMADEFGKVLVELSQLGHPEETQMFIAQAVLQLLVIENRDGAYATYIQYCSHHPSLRPAMPPPFYRRPLLNFTWFLLLSIDIGNFDVFQCLCTCYAPVLRVDPSYYTYIMKIGELYFNMQQNKNAANPGGLMGLLTGEGFDSMVSSLANMFPEEAMSMPLPATDIDNMLETAEGLD